MENVYSDTISDKGLRVDGASMIFYSLRSFQKPISDDILRSLAFDNSNFLRQLYLSDGYAEKIFKAGRRPFSNLIFEIADPVSSVIHLPLKDNDVVSEIALKNYLYIYEGRILEIQSVAVIDRNSLSDRADVTEASASLTNTDIVKMINEIIRSKESAQGYFYNMIDGIFSSVLSMLSSDTFTAEYSPVHSRENSSVSVQIWDIASENNEENSELEFISGNSLAKKYELEISAILSCHNEYFAREDLWQKQSEDIVRSNLSLEAAVLNDHKVFSNDRVCVEISQINKPEFREISRVRLETYGYDSTSIFVTGYLTIIAAGYERCKSMASDLHSKTTSVLDNGVNDYNELKGVMLDEQRILNELTFYDSLPSLFVEDRHMRFFDKGGKLRKFKDIKDYIAEVFSDLSMLTEIILSFNSSQNGDRTAMLLSRLNEMIEAQDRENQRMEVLSLILGFSAVFSLCDFINDLFPQTDQWYYNLAIFGVSVIILLVLFKLLSVPKGKKDKDKDRKK